MCSVFTPDCGYEDTTNILIGDVYCPNTKCLVNFACTKRLFSLLAEAIMTARNARLCVRCTIFLLKIKQIPFSSRLVKGFTFLKRVQNQFKMFLEMCFVLASSVPTERNANLLEVVQQLRDRFMVVESVGLGCLFTKLLSQYKST